MSFPESKNLGIAGLDLLIKSGANVNIANQKGKTGICYIFFVLMCEALHLVVQLGLDESMIENVISQKGENICYL